MTKSKEKNVQLTLAQRREKEKATFVEQQKCRLLEAAEIITTAFEALGKAGCPTDNLTPA